MPKSPESMKTESSERTGPRRCRRHHRKGEEGTTERVKKAPLKGEEATTERFKKRRHYRKAEEARPNGRRLEPPRTRGQGWHIAFSPSSLKDSS
jgi:hypothetical protein